MRSQWKLPHGLHLFVPIRFCWPSIHKPPCNHMLNSCPSFVQSIEQIGLFYALFLGRPAVLAVGNNNCFYILLSIYLSIAIFPSPSRSVSTWAVSFSIAFLSKENWDISFFKATCHVILLWRATTLTTTLSALSAKKTPFIGDLKRQLNLIC